MRYEKEWPYRETYGHSCAGLLCLSIVGCDDKRMTNLEQRVEQLEAERTKHINDDDETRRMKLENCVAEPEGEFRVDLVNNGTKARNGSYNNDGTNPAFTCDEQKIIKRDETN